MSALRPIPEVAADLELDPGHVIPWGPDRAKIDLAALAGRSPSGRLILVSAITPTTFGEGKTTVAIALAMGMRALGHRAVVTLREPSLGPIFGIKGGGTGGGAATVEPGESINLHFTGDSHAVASAHNLLAALVDNALHFGTAALDPRLVTWPRAVDMNDRALRNVLVGLGGPADGPPRESGFQITAASEVMAALCLAEDHVDLEHRLARMVVGWGRDDRPVTAGDLGAAPAMLALLRDALMPNLVQTRDGGPALVHGGPFANIAHGTNSMLATRLALATGADVITEAGFGFDLGGQKFLDIACPAAGVWPRLVVLVVTLRALRRHGGAAATDAAWHDGAALARGLAHLQRHLLTVGGYGLPPVVAVNRFPDDPAADVAAVVRWCRSRGVPAVECTGFADGAAGATALAGTVGEVLANTDSRPPQPWHPYAPDAGYAQKVQAVARHAYGADDVDVTAQASAELARISGAAGTELPVCIAKTPLSLSDDPTRTGVPHEFTITVRDARLAAGAGFVVVSTGSVVTMPGLPRRPAALRVRLREDGTIAGLMAGG